MFVRKLVYGLVAAFALSAIACEAPPEPAAKPQPTSTQTEAVKPVAPPERPAVTAKPAVPSKPVAPALLEPEKATEKAPAKYKVKFVTTQGDVVFEVTRAWAPNGADRFYNLVKIGYFEDIAFFRVVDGFMAQFGIHGAPEVNTKWRMARIDDDPVKESNKRGYLTFATSGPNSRTVQMFINFKDNARLDASGFAPIGKVVEGMDIVDKLYKGYGEGAPRGDGPDQGRVQMQGNSYLRDNFPKMDYIKSASLLK